MSRYARPTIFAIRGPISRACQIITFACDILHAVAISAIEDGTLDKVIGRLQTKAMSPLVFVTKNNMDVINTLGRFGAMLNDNKGILGNSGNDLKHFSKPGRG
jgi:hypothetical protein